MKRKDKRVLVPRSQARKVRSGGLAAFWLERLSSAEDLLGDGTSRRVSRKGLTTLSLSSPAAARTRSSAVGVQLRDSEIRFPRFRRRGLTTLSLNGVEPVLPPPLFSPDPQITTTDIWLRRLDPSHDDLRIVQLSDIHHSLYTPLEAVERAVYLANQLHPDVVALTGDYVTLSTDYIWPVARALGKLEARLGVFAVLGNHDFQVDADQITRALQAHGIDVLRNSHRALAGGLDPQWSSTAHGMLWIVGVDDLWWRADDLSAAMRSLPPEEAKILLCHNPLGIHQAASFGIDFVLSGHTHGGQVRLPVMKSLYRSKLGARFVEGWNRLEETQIYVNRGIGKVLVPVRFDCPPEIACFRLRKARATDRVTDSEAHNSD